jgi:hypothetical protein
MKRPSVQPCRLSESLHRQLNSYALAASAAGVGVLALAQPAAARIVYTPAKVKIGYLAYHLDLNHDGITDFQIETGYSTNQTFKTADIFAFAPMSQRGNKMAHAKGRVGLARALKPGVRIGPGDISSSAGFLVWEEHRNQGTNFRTGQWINVKNRYLGLSFQIKGKTHYGWARLNVKVTRRGFDAVLTGYAYETIPNKPIIAGKTRDTNGIVVEVPHANLAMPTREPASLGALATGAPGLSIWRREAYVSAAPEGM